MPLLTEYLQIVYSLFNPGGLLVAYLLWPSGGWRVSFLWFPDLDGLPGFYVFYFLVPARGPRFLLSQIQHTQLEACGPSTGFAIYSTTWKEFTMDCFPSGHTEQTCWRGGRLSGCPKSFYIFTIFTDKSSFLHGLSGYHYVVDLVQGGVIAAILDLCDASVV